MKTIIAAGLLAVTAHVAAPAYAQAPAGSTTTTTTTTTTASAKLSVDTTPISDIIKNPAGKAVLESNLPQISQYYDQIGGMTLKQVQPMSQGAITDDMLKKIQADFDKL